MGRIRTLDQLKSGASYSLQDLNILGERYGIQKVAKALKKPISTIAGQDGTLYRYIDFGDDLQPTLFLDMGSNGIRGWSYFIQAPQFHFEDIGYDPELDEFNPDDEDLHWEIPDEIYDFVRIGKLADLTYGNDEGPSVGVLGKSDDAEYDDTVSLRIWVWSPDPRVREFFDHPDGHYTVGMEGVHVSDPLVRELTKGFDTDSAEEALAKFTEAREAFPEIFHQTEDGPLPY